jgi:6-pyruvoyltetrahydropterin/6-carboxytetrahydropterin synthase
MRLYTIAKKFTFSASHQLRFLPADHPCSRLHGHNYTVEIELASKSLDEVGFVVDYRALDQFKKWLDDTFDHKHINDVVGFNPTAENLARAFHGTAASMFGPVVTAVRVQETDKTVAEWRQ